MQFVADALLYGIGTALMALAFYAIYEVMKAESNKNKCPHPICRSNIKHNKQYIYEDVWACECCHRGLIITPMTSRRVTDLALLQAIRHRLQDDRLNNNTDIGTLNYLQRLEGIVEARIQKSTSVEVEQ